MKTILATLIIELITALLLEALRNIEISLDPPSLETRLGPVGIRWDGSGFHLLWACERVI